MKEENLIDKCVDAIRSIFSHIIRIDAEIEVNTDAPASPPIVVRIEVASDQETALREYDAWVDWTLKNLYPKERALVSVIVSRQ